MQSLNSLFKRIESSLSNKSEIVYVYPALPCFIIFIVSIISASVYVTKKVDHQSCVLQNPNSSDYLQEYVLGSIIVGYIFLAVYSNILLEMIPKLKGIVASFLLLFIWSLGSFIWNIIGATMVSKSHCKSTQYYGIAVLNLVVYFLYFGGLVFYSIYVWINHKKEDKADVQVNPNYVSQPQNNDKNK
ncbi:hypothetical protein ABPG74_011826 [Tetrahymena malaccensis]